MSREKSIKLRPRSAPEASMAEGALRPPKAPDDAKNPKMGEAYGAGG